jgi:hypothetical protein
VSNSIGERYRDAVGVTPRQLDTLLAVMSFTRVFGSHPSRPILFDFLGCKPMTSDLVQSGWLETRGKSNECRVYAATDKAWRVLGFSRIRETESESAA